MRLIHLVKKIKEVDICDEKVVSDIQIEVNEIPEEDCEVLVNDFEAADDNEATEASGTDNRKSAVINANNTDLAEREIVVEIEELGANLLHVEVVNLNEARNLEEEIGGNRVLDQNKYFVTKYF